MEVNGFDSNILNMSLELTLEWGENWLAPIQERIRKKQPSLTLSEADFLDSFTKKIQKDIHSYILQVLAEKQIESEELQEIVYSLMKNNYPWIDEKNSDRLFNQGCYYAWKDGCL